MAIPFDQTIAENIRGSTSDKFDTNPISFSFDATPYYGVFEPGIEAPVLLASGKFDGQPSLVRTSEQNKQQFRTAVALWDDLIGVSLAEKTGDRSADIIIDTVSDLATGTLGFTYTTLETPLIADDADVFLRNVPASQLTSGANRQAFMVAVHELGHALGLRHPDGLNFVSAALDPYDSKAADIDTHLVTIMSYFNPNSYDSNINWSQRTYAAQTPMIFDIWAVQQKYGADFTTREGRTTYGFNSNAGRDVFNFDLNKAPVLTIWDGGGRDRLDVSGFSNNQFIDLHEGAFSNIGVLPGTASTIIKNVGIAYGTRIEEAKGGSGDDHIIGNALNNSLYGSGGNDLIQSENGDDYLDGEDGNDTLDGAENNDNLFGGAGNDFLIGADGNDTLDGESGNDVLRGGAGTNQIKGGSGDDRFESEAEATNTINGGLGNDWYVLGDGADAITDDGGYDTIVFNNSTIADWQQDRYIGSIENDFWDPTLFEQFLGSASIDFILMRNDFFKSFDIRAGAGNDSVSGGGSADQLWGDAGDDTLRGQNGRDAVEGGLGFDNIFGDAGNDRLRGGFGNDSLNGGTGFDTADFSDHFGSAARGWTIDLIAGTATTLFNARPSSGLLFTTETDTLTSIESVVGSKGNDAIQSGQGRITELSVFVIGGNPLIDGVEGVDRLILAPTITSAVSILGRTAHDVVTFTGDNAGLVTTATTILKGSGIIQSFTDAEGRLNFTNIEILDTGVGNDVVTGSANSDHIILGDGNDRVTGGVGPDRLEGGVGADTFIYSITAHGNDTIVNFDADDVFQFASAGFGNLTKGTLRAANFWSNTTGLAHDADDRFIYNTTDSALWFDSNGNAAGGEIVKIADLTNDFALKAGDILIV